MNGKRQECGHIMKSMFLVFTTSHPFLLGLPLPLGWPQSCLFYIPVSKACSYFPLPSQAYSPCPGRLTHPGSPLTHLPSLLPTHRSWSREFRFLISLQTPQPVATPLPWAPQSLVLMSLPSPPQSSTYHQVLVGSAISVLPLSNLILHFPGPCPQFLCFLHNPSASIPSIISFLTLQSQFPYQTSPRQYGQWIQSPQGTLSKFLKSQGKPREECQRKHSKRSSRDLV